ncbi:hypothetical protein GCM10028798_18300 [Humibacter antri]
MAATQGQAGIQRIIEKNLGRFRVPGVLSVRPGFRMRDRWITDERAIVVTVAAGTDAGASGVPDALDGVAVDVRTASSAKAAQLAELGDPGAHAAARESTAIAPDLGGVPVFPGERVLTGDAGPAGGHAMDATSVEAAAKPAKEHLAYTAPPGVPLAPVSGEIELELSASPDSGWPVLSAFLAGTQNTLTVGLYDFTSAHVLARFETAATGKRVVFVLDHPPRNPTADQTDDQTVADLKKSLGAFFEQAWALERADPHASAWIFPSAYHIKVAVRDSSTVWLSSGNWNDSNQPDIDPVHDPADAAQARTRDRDWHVVIHDAGLARTFEAYLKHDYAVAVQHQEPTATAAEPALIAQPLAETPPFEHFTAAETITDQVTITPVLTPDPGVYADAVRALIESASTSLHLQFQYIEAPSRPSDASAPFSALIEAVIARQNAGVDVRIIMSEYETAGYLEQLQQLGLDVVSNVKLQNNVHNKGIVVDGSRTLVSSQNWSTAGTLENRDAGVIIDSARVASYYDGIFAHDWEHLATQHARED